jgi:hypothetical protein
MNIKEECIGKRRSTKNSAGWCEIHFVKIEGEVKTSASLRLSFLCVKTDELFDFVVIPTKSNNSQLCWY